MLPPFLFLHVSLKMEEALPLLHSNFVMKCCNLWLLFIVSVTCFSSCCGACNFEPFNCSGLSFEYPFGRRSSGCGDPLLQLDCDHNNSDGPLLDTNGAQYYVLEKSPSSTREGSLIVIDRNLKECHPSLTYSTMPFWSSNELHIVEEYKNITLWHCQDDPPYGPNKAITNNFAAKIGEGGFGVVFKGKLLNGTFVYSFGMLLLEIVGARRNIDVRVSRSIQMYFPEWVFKLMQNGQLEMMLKGRGRGEIGCEEEEEKAKRLTKVGLWCIQYNSRDRPSMSKVVQMLEGNGEDVSDPPTPFNSSIRPTLLQDIVSESSWS